MKSIGVCVCVALVLVATVTSAAGAAVESLALIPFPPNAVNNNGDVVGGMPLPSVAQLWKKGTATPIALPSGYVTSQAYDISDKGAIAGKSGNGSINQIVHWTSAAAAPELHGEGRNSFISNDGRLLYNTLFYKDVIRSDNVLITVDQSQSITADDMADDGAFLTSGIFYPNNNFTGNEDPTLSRYYPSAGNYTLLPNTLDGRDVAPNGYVVTLSDAFTDSTGPVVLLHLVQGAWVQSSLGQVGGLDARNVQVNGKGRVVAAAQTNFPTDSRVGVWSRKGPAWEQFTAKLMPPAGATSTYITGIADINEWGDILVSYDKNEGGLFTARVPLTGILEGAGAGARSERSVGGFMATGSSQAGKVVTLTDGTASLTATANAKGSFTIGVPPGQDLTLKAPAGSCFVTANGCQSTAPLNANDKLKSISLAATKVTNLANFVGKVGSKLTRKSSKVKVGVKCNAAKSCKVTVTLRSGKKVLGKGSATIKSKKTAQVSVGASSKGKAKASLTITSGTAKATIVQSFTIK